MPQAINLIHLEMQENKIKTNDIRDVQKLKLGKEEITQQWDPFLGKKRSKKINLERNAKIKFFSQHTYKEYSEKPKGNRKP